MSARLIVVTVNYCCADLILDSLDETVAQLEALGDGAYWIVDNNSPDDSVPKLRAALAERDYGPRVRLIVSEVNDGFGAGNNIAFRTGMAEPVPPDYFYMLNPDATPQPGAIEALVRFMESHPEVGAAGSLLCDETGETQPSIFRFPSIYNEIERALRYGIVSRLLKHHDIEMDMPPTPGPADWVTGASFVVRRSVLETAGLFDETFFLYWEEVELCHRIWAAGFKIYGVPASRVMHIGGVSTGVKQPARRIPAYWFFSRAYFFRVSGRGGPPLLRDLIVTLCLLLRRAKQMLFWRPLKPPYYLRDFITYNFFKSPEQRPQEKQP